MVEFTDEASVEAWVSRLAVEEGVMFAALNAALVYPTVANRERIIAPNYGLLAGRAILVALVRSRFAEAKIENAAERAAAAYATTNSADFSAAYFAASVASGSSNGIVVADNLFAQNLSEALEGGGISSAMAMPLWADYSLSTVATEWDELRKWMSLKPNIWGFWIDWYEGLLEGRAPDWELWREVALIPNVVWQTGPEAVAEAIAGIKRRRMVRVAPPLVLDEAARVFHVAAPSDVPDDVLGYVKGRVGLAFRNALAASKSNGFTESSYEAVTISSALDDPEARADVLAGAFYDAALGFVANIGEVYPDDVALVNLKNVLYAASEEICEFDEQARQRCLRIAKLQIAREPSVDDVADLNEMVAVAQEYSDDVLAEILAKDAALIAKKQRSPKWVRARFMQYMTTIGDYLERAKKGDARVTWLVAKIGKLWDWFTVDGL